MARRFSNYNLSDGAQTNAPANVIGENKAQSLSGVNFDTIGAIKSAKSSTDVLSFGLSGDITGIHVFYDAGTKRYITVAGTGLYYNDIQAKQLANTGKFTFCDHNGAVYCASAENTIVKVTNGGNVWNMGCPAPPGTFSIADTGAGYMNCGADSNYRARYTYVSRHYRGGVDGGYYDTEGPPSEETSVTSVGAGSIAISNMDNWGGSGDYDIVAKRMYLKGGDDPSLSDWYRTYTRDPAVDDATVAQLTLKGWQSQMAATKVSGTINVRTNLDRVDTLLSLNTDNELPPRAKYITNNFDHFFFAGDPTYPDRTYFSKVSNENVPSTNWVKDTSDIMGMVKWNNAIWTPTKDKLYVKVGANEDNFYNQDTEVSDGCIAPYTLVGTPYGLVYLSYNGVVLYNGQSQTVTMLSKEIEDVFLALPSEYYENACATYFDHEYWISVTKTGATYNDDTYIYNFLTNGWRHLSDGYRCFAKDEKAFKLYGAYAGGSEVVEMGSGDLYETLTYWTRDYEYKLTPYSSPIRMFPQLLHVDINTNGGDVLAIPYYDGTPLASITINTSSRQNKTYRLPNYNCYRFSVLFVQVDTSKQVVFYSYDIEVEK